MPIRLQIRTALARARLGTAFWRAAIPILLMAATLRAQTAPAQTARAVPVPAPCMGVGEIGSEMYKPFTAEIVTKSVNRTADGTLKPTESVEFVARDSRGRIRIERNGFVPSPGMEADDRVTLHTRDGGTIQTTQRELARIVVIQDCYTWKSISLQPGMRIARVNGGDSVHYGENIGKRPYSIHATNLLDGKQGPQWSVEDLGTKEIEGFGARGVLQTFLGTDDDEWKGKPTGSYEIWASDELAVTILQIRKNLKDGGEERNIFTNIHRGEPNPALFEVPVGYLINPTADELPHRDDRKFSLSPKSEK